MQRTSRVVGLCVLALSLCLVACDGDDRNDDAGTRDAGSRDAGSVDAGTADAGSMVDGGQDAGDPPVDAGTDGGTDAGSADGGMDAGPVDGGPGDSGPVDAGPPVDAGLGPLGDSCDDAPDLTAGGTFSGSTFMATNDYDPAIACVGGGPASGRDLAFRLMPSTTTTYQVTVTPTDSAYDPMLYYQLGSPCDFSGGCEDGTVLNGAGTFERLMMTIDGGQTAFVVVDGELASRGAFTLDISILE